MGVRRSARTGSARRAARRRNLVREARMIYKGMTLNRHIVETEREHAGATGQFSGLLSDLGYAVKTIAASVRRAGLADVLGLTGQVNVQGEQVQKLDDIAHATLVRAMEHAGHLCAMGSEECEEPIAIPDHYPKGKYVLLFDPLDGSSNIDANVSIGTIFAIYKRRSPGGAGCLEDLLQRGRALECAGYVVYGSSTMLVYSTGNGVAGFTYDPTIGEFLLSHVRITMPARGKIYSVNEGNTSSWHENVRRYVEHLKTKDKPTGRPYSSRYIGSLVADFHRNLLYGGIFMYPADYSNPEKPKGKLRLMYEANPLSFVAEHAGGYGSDGTRPILDIDPESLHQRVPLFIGSRDDVMLAEKFVRGEM
jgi:fructose-1,6-bisphosphatase I